MIIKRMKCIIFTIASISVCSPPHSSKALRENALVTNYRGFAFKSAIHLKADFVRLRTSFRMSTMMRQSPKLLNEKTRLRAPKKRAFKRETPVLLKVCRELNTFSMSWTSSPNILLDPILSYRIKSSSSTHLLLREIGGCGPNLQCGQSVMVDEFKELKFCEEKNKFTCW